MYITASKLYDYIQCPHRVWRDEYGPQDEKIKETNPFVELLWTKGVAYERKRMSMIEKYLDLSEGTLDERFQKTLEALKQGVPLIYQGVLRNGNLLGIPDLLKKESTGYYIPIDIKSGFGYEGADEDEGEEGKPKKHYAVQLALYVDVLRQLGFENDYRGVILDIEGNEIVYNLNDALGVKNKTTLWEFYQSVRNEVELIMSDKEKPLPALASICKLCPWYNSCTKWVKENDDPTEITQVGRSKRDVILQDLGISKASEIPNLDVGAILKQKAADKKFLSGIGEKTLQSIIARARILKVTQKPVIYGKIEFPQVTHELFFDIEDDPTQDFVYMHGVYERSPEGERYIDFTAHEISPEAEKETWVNFWKYIQTLPKDNFSVYYYSHHEKTTYRKMQKKYPDVISGKEVDDFFDNPNVIDLYKIVMKNTDWPLSNYSLKALAVYLGFEWRDKTPSGALSIEWFNKYIETKDQKEMERILLYNEDDCKATMILKDGLVALQAKK